MSFTLFPDARLALARDSLAGLSVGDALGSQFFVPGRRPRPGRRSAAPAALAVDRRHRDGLLGAGRPRHPGDVDRDRLALAFAERCEPYRGYGPGAVTILRLIRTGTPWPVAAASAFDGQGSCGNGAAMRVAPLGACYRRLDQPAPPAQARASAEVTHAHPEGIAGAVAVAVAASLAARARLDGHRPAHGPAARRGRRRARPGRRGAPGLRRAAGLLGRPLAEAVAALGNGSRVTAQDTVAFTLWVAATHLDDYPAAIRACVEAGGDVDTTAAIVGGDRRRRTPASAPRAGCPTTGWPPASRCRTGWPDGQAGRVSPHVVGWRQWT